MPDMDINKLNKINQDIIKDYNKDLDIINFIFCSDEYLLKVNQEYLQHDYYTDIITFDYSDEFIQSDIFISIDRVKENALELNLSFNDELHRIIFHGVLHLVGFEDKDDESKKIMTEREDYYLSAFNQLKDKQ